MSKHTKNENMVYDFEKIVSEHQKMIYRLAYRFFGNHEDADDVVQKTFLKAYEKIYGFEGRSSLKTWLYQIALNICRNGLRDKRYKDSHKPETLNPEQPSPLSQAMEKEESRILRKALNELPAKQKETITLRAFDDLSFKEVGAILGLSENAAKVNFHHGVKKIKEIIEKGKNT